MITIQCITERIKDETYQIVDLPEGSRMTLCFITMKYGFVVTGQSSCINAEDFDEELGKLYAFDNAFDKLWELEGYRLKESD